VKQANLSLEPSPSGMRSRSARDFTTTLVHRYLASYCWSVNSSFGRDEKLQKKILFRDQKMFDEYLNRIFGSKRDEVTGEWRKRHNEELHNLYSSPTTVWVIKSRRMRCAGHVARILFGKLTGPQLIKKFSKFYLTRRFITAIITARQLSVIRASSIQSLT
jgi:hypothetical protein